MARGLPPDLGASRGVTARLGPTNTGKTHHAIRRMLGYRTGMIGLPLRLLAREVYDRVVAEVGADAVALVTGEEKIVPSGVRYWICTVESMPVERPVSFLAVDEIQLAADPVRGHVFTDRILRARGGVETWFLGSDTMAPVLEALIPTVQVVRQPRLSSLSFVGTGRVERLPSRAAIVAFSAHDVYALAARVRARHGGVAIVMGALSPRTRNAQVALYQSGEVPFLVATDAIGMGLNLDVHHVALAATAKFDGRRHRALRADEVAQIAGRAGRWRRDGTFGTTSDAAPLADEVVDAVVRHRFSPVRRLAWRNPDLDRSSPEALLASLSVPPPRRDLLRAVEEGDDHRALRRLLEMDGVQARAGSPDALDRLWGVCGVPDFGNVLPEHHAGLLARLFARRIEGDGTIPDDDLAQALTRIDRPTGDVSTLMARLAAIRTWTFIAHRPGWVGDASGWQARAAAVEERLSDALHVALTERFVDRRSRGWARALASGSLPDPVVDGDGVVRAGDEVLGLLDGLRFEPAVGREDGDATRTAIRQVVAPLVADRLVDLAADPAALALDDDGWVRWDGAAVGRLVPGLDWRFPRVRPARTDLLDGAARGRLAQALEAWRTGELRARDAPLDRAIAAVPPGGTRGLIEALRQHLGVVRRDVVGELLVPLTPEDRSALRRVGIRIGRRWVWHDAMARRTAIRRRLLAVFGEDVPTLPEHGGRRPFSARWRRQDADRVGLEAVDGGWVRVDVAEAWWDDPARAARVFRWSA